jgi:hypothetical protein
MKLQRAASVGEIHLRQLRHSFARMMAEGSGSLPGDLPD